MEIKELVINEDIKGVKTERLHFDLFTDNSFLNVTLINSPAKIHKDILNDFSSKSKLVNLITLDKRKWTTTIINFDNELLHVMAPQGFKIYIGELVIVEFPTDKDDYIIQVVLHKYVIPVLSLKFLDPRIDKRYPVPANTNIYYRKIDHDVCWITDSKYFMSRNTGYRNGESRSMVIKETIGMICGLNAEGGEDISYLDKETEELMGNMLKADIKNISAGGCAIMVDDKDIKLGSLLFLSLIIDIKDIKYKFNSLELLLFAVVRNIRPVEGGICNYGLKFVKHLDKESLHNFLEIWSAQVNSTLNI